MLALKVVLARARLGADAAVFDEVDTGVGGATAAAVGERLARPGGKRAGAGRDPRAAGRGARRCSICGSPRTGAAAEGEDHGDARAWRSTASAGARRSPACWPADRVTDEARAAADRLMGGRLHDEARARQGRKPARPEALDAAKAERRARALAAEIAHHDALYYQQDAPEISDADYDALRRAQRARSRRAFPELVRADSPSPARRRGAGRGLRQGRATRVPMLSLGNAFADEDVTRLRRPRAPLPAARRRRRRSPSPPSRRSTACRSRCATRTAGSCEAATRGDGTEGENVTANVRTIADIPHALQGRERPRADRGARRDLHGARRFRAPATSEQAAAGEQGLRQSAQRRRRLAAPARSRDHRVAAAALLRLCLGRGAGAAGRHAVGRRSRRFADWGFPVNPLTRVCQSTPRSCSPTIARSSEQRAGARLRHRRRRLQGGPARLAGAPRLRRRARRAGPSPTSSPPSRRRPCCAASTSRSAAPAR